jgi:hypothetical protein
MALAALTVCWRCIAEKAEYILQKRRRILDSWTRVSSCGDDACRTLCEPKMSGAELKTAATMISGYAVLYHQHTVCLFVFGLCYD